MGEPSTRHWLVEAARQQHLRGADQLDLGDTGTMQAWGIVARACDVSPAGLAEAVARQFSLQTWDERTPPDRVATKLLPEGVARQYQALPVVADARKLVVAVADPRDRRMVIELRRVAQRQVELRIAPPELIDSWILGAYSALGAAERASFALPGSDAWRDSIGDSGDAAVQLTAGILQQAYDARATDIHIQPFVGGGLVRYRVDGLLRRGPSFPASVLSRVLNRIKALAGMDVTDRLRPHDGRAELRVGSDTIDLRISTIPVEGVEKMVIRLLGRGRLPAFSDLGFIEPAGSQVRDLLTRREGIAFVTGPTGSGKSTTIQACLALLNSVDVNIVTVESPVEYRVPGLAQVEIDDAKGLTYALALRSILRQDPNLIVVGEIRDAETAGIAMEAALTGHPVLTTIHTPDALGVVPRLLELGVPRTLVADGFTGATGQRLVRRLCPKCSGAPEGAGHEAAARYERLTGRPAPMRAVGCAECGYSGYKGRLPVAQVLLSSAGLRDVVLSPRATGVDLRAAARDAGMRTLGEAASDAIVAGLTTPEEAARALGSAFWTDLTSAARAVGFGLSVDAGADRRPRPDPAAGRPAVLVVSAVDGSRADLVQMLLGSGFDALGADGADSAARALAGDKPIVALVIDVQRPNGSEPPPLNEWYRALGPSGLPAVLLLDGQDAEVRAIVESNGVDDYLTRPLQSAAELGDRVKAVLERRQAGND